jgi:hypothetical protein
LIKNIAVSLIILCFVGSIIASSTSISNDYGVQIKNGDNLDQYQHEITGGFLVNGQWSVAQSFVPSYNMLTRVKLSVSYYHYGYTDLHFYILDDLEATPLVHMQVSPDEIPESDPSNAANVEYTEFDFPDFEVEPGKTYFIKLSTETYYWTEYLWGGADGTDYVAGDIWKLNSQDTPPEWWKDQYSDSAFETYGYNNNAPEKPTITGPPQGTPNTDYVFYVQTTDIDEDQIYYYIDWDDESVSNWIGPFESGDTYVEIHQWSSIGMYNVRVKARDTNMVESEWSDPLSVSMPRNRQLRKLPVLEIIGQYPKILQMLQSLLKLS